MENMAEATVTRTVRLDAPCCEVWQNLVRPEDLAAWMGGPVSVDVRPGGVGRASLPDGDRSILVTSVDDEHRLGWLWWDDEGQVSSVELRLAPEGAGCRLTVIERAVVNAPASACLVGA